MPCRHAASAGKPVKHYWLVSQQAAAEHRESCKQLSVAQGPKPYQPSLPGLLMFGTGSPDRQDMHGFGPFAADSTVSYSEAEAHVGVEAEHLLRVHNKHALQGGESQSEVGARVISSVERIACQHPGK